MPYSNRFELLSVRSGSLASGLGHGQEQALKLGNEASAAAVAAFLFPSLLFLQRLFSLLLAGAHYVEEADEILQLLPLLVIRISLRFSPWAFRPLPGAE